MASPTFNVGGLATGLDTNSIVDKLTQLESRPLDLLKQRQTAFQAQVSVLGETASRLSALATAARSLATGGVLGTKATSTNSAFSAVPGSGAVAGASDVQVTQLAAPAKWRSGAFAASDTVTGGTLTLTVAGTAYAMVVADGTAPSDLAFAIRQSGAPVSAVVLSDDLGTHLALTTTDTGFSGADPGAALQVSFAATGSTGQVPGFAPTQAARNATFTIDGLPFTRASNIVTDALPGTTLTLKAQGGAAETLSIANDTDATQARLKTFVDAYNAVARVVEGQLAVTKDTDRSSTLAGDATMRMLQRALQGLGSAVVPGLSTVRSLADLGLKTERDGTLSISTDTLSAALARDPAAVNSLFAAATSGISQQVSTLVDAYTAPGSGLLTARQDGLGRQLRQMTTQADQMQLRIDAYREGLMAQFTAMEKAVSSMKSVGSFLTSQSATSTR